MASRTSRNDVLHVSFGGCCRADAGHNELRAPPVNFSVQNTLALGNCQAESG